MNSFWAGFFCGILFSIVALVGLLTLVDDTPSDPPHHEVVRH